MTKKEIEKQKVERFNQIRKNNQGDIMKVVEYSNAKNITVEFQDKHKAKICTTYDNFLNGCINNPYHPIVFNHGIAGEKYPITTNHKTTKEYQSWKSIIQRCFDEKYKTKQPTYEEAICCDEWLNFENFYEWIHSQSNFDKWLNGKRWAIDKDILIKGNKVYSPDTCCLVPQNVNNLFTKSDLVRGLLPIGVHKHNKKYQVFCQNPFTKKQEALGTYDTKIAAFLIYKEYKEDIIRQVAKIEFNNKNITKSCYEAMMKYIVEIDD